MNPELALNLAGGVARWRELEHSGVNREELCSAVELGRVHRPHRGVYALPGTPRREVLATIFRARIGCLDGLAQRGVPVFPSPACTHLVVPASRAIGKPRERPVSEVSLHRSNLPGSTATDLSLATRCVGAREHLALTDAALNRRLVTREQLATLPTVGAERRTWLVEWADARAESPSESYARLDLREAGLVVEPQVTVAAVGRVDLLVEGRVVVELDGYAYHSGQAEFTRDRQRDRVLAALGYSVLRYSFLDVVEGADIVADVTAVLWRRGEVSSELRTRLDAAAREKLRLRAS